MVSHLFFYQLVLLALVWLFVMLHLTWPKRPVTAPATPAQPEPLKPKRHRSNEPKPFEGLTHKPHCALCERDTAHPQAPPPVPPDPMPPTNRRPREVDTSSTSVRMPVVTTGAGWGWAICAPTVIPVAAPGASSTVRRVRGTFWRPMARSSTANRPRWSSSCGSWPVWRKAWVSAPRRGSSRSTPTRCCSGWAKRPSSCAPFPRISCVTSTWSSCNSTSCTRCCATSKPARSATTRRSSVWSAHPTGCGRRWTPRASCWWWSMSAAARWRWRSASCIR